MRLAKVLLNVAGTRPGWWGPALAAVCLLPGPPPGLGAEPPWQLGGHWPDELPPLTAEELSSPRMQALWLALAGDPYGHRADDHARSGGAMQVRPRAIHSNNAHYGGYQVGGGVPLQGRGPAADEGTFGWDYFGLTVPKRVALRWSRTPRPQGGAGQYRTTGARWPGRE